ncbi:hypothetical protein ACLB1T_30180 [Escherichia coli]
MNQASNIRMPVWKLRLRTRFGEQARFHTCFWQKG